MDDDLSSDVSALWAELHSAAMFAQLARRTDDPTRRQRAKERGRLAVRRARLALREASLTSLKNPECLTMTKVIDELATTLGELDA